MTRMAGIKSAIRKAGGLNSLNLKKSHLLVLLALADYENDDTGECFPCSETIGLENDQDESRVRTYWGQLRKMGYLIELYRLPSPRGVGKIIYWAFNEQIFPKVCIANRNIEGEINCKSQHDPSLKENEMKKRKISKVNNSNSNSGSRISWREEEEGSREEDGQSPPMYEVGGGEEDGDSLGQEEEDEVVSKAKVEPTLPVMLSLLSSLTELGITHPRKKKSWRIYESSLVKRYSSAELMEMPEILTWAFTRDFWRKALADPRKGDLIGFFVDNAGRMREDFQINRAKAMVDQGLGQGESISPPEKFERPQPPENRLPTRPLGRLFLSLLVELGILYQDTSTWDVIEEKMQAEYSAAVLQEVPGAMKLLLTPNVKPNFWTTAMLDGKKPNLFGFFARNLRKILNDTQVSNARVLLNRASHLEEIKNGTRKTVNRWA
jgi:hypothetical protein